MGYGSLVAFYTENYKKKTPLFTINSEWPCQNTPPIGCPAINRGPECPKDIRIYTYPLLSHQLFLNKISLYSNDHIARILANYMVWHLIKPLVNELSKPFRDASLELLKVEKGVEGGAPPWKSCVTKTNSVMGFATGYLYIKERSGRNTKEEVSTTCYCFSI